MSKLVTFIAVAALLVALAANIARAEDAGPTFTFGASTSYLFDINDPDDPGLNAATYSSFEQDDSFNIDMIQLGVTGQRGRASYGATLDFGDLAAAAGDSDDGDVALQTAWLSFDFDAAAVAAGRFGTPIGYEVLEPWGNAHISRSWGWTGQPINHDGAKVSGTLGPVDLMIGAVNSFTVSDPDGNDIDEEKGVIWSAGGALAEALNLYFSGIYTEEDDTVDTLMLNAIVSGGIPAGDVEVSYAVEGNWRNDDPDGGSEADFGNIGAYLGAAFGQLGIAGRIDYSDDEGIVTGADTDLWSITLTGSWTLVDGLIARLEYRHDDADEDIFNDDGSTDDSLDTIQAQIIWLPEI